MLYETRALQQAYAAQTKQDCVKFCGAYCMTEFFENNFADFSNVVGVKRIRISSSCWWHFQLATSPIMLNSCLKQKKTNKQTNKKQKKKTQQQQRKPLDFSKEKSDNWNFAVRLLFICKLVCVCWIGNRDETEFDLICRTRLIKIR